MDTGFRDLLPILMRRLWLIVSIVVAACLFTGYYSYAYAKTTYTATSRLLVNPVYHNSQGDTVLDRAVFLTNLYLMKSYMEIVRSETILDIVAARLPEFEATGPQLSGWVSTEAESNSHILRIEVSSDDYRKSALVANEIARVFVETVPGVMKLDNAGILNLANPDQAAAPLENPPLVNVLFAAAIAFAFAVGLSFLLHHLDDTVRTDEELHDLLGVPRLAVVPVIRGKDMKKKKKPRRAGEAWVQAAEREITHA